MELSLPAGSLENALVAFKYGADSVYFGLKNFSARKGAENFSPSDLAKIKEFSVKNNKKFYIAINTLIDDVSLPLVYEDLKLAEKYHPDGIICQDLGLGHIIRRDFPSIPLHASTQLAVHNVSGVKELENLGYSRMVLSRELSFDQIKKIRQSCPDVELKVFIHGAMCYGFSGLCFASFVKTGRSGNAGECSQVCRTYFTDKNTGKTIYPFSLKDLSLEENILRLGEIGIDALKIEGRLKGNEYVKATTLYYRNLIDNKKSDNFLKDKMYTSFLRDRSSGYFDYHGPDHKNLNTSYYSQHLGKEIGRIIDISKNTITVENPVKNHDGLMILKKTKLGIETGYKFSAKTRDGYSLYIDDPEQFKVGEKVYLISDSSENVKSPSLELPLYKPERTISIGIGNDGITIEGQTFKTDVNEAISNKAFEEIERIFRQSGEAQFSPLPIIKNNSSFDCPHIASKELKRIRREAYSALNGLIINKKYTERTFRTITSIPLPDRNLISDNPLPFNMKGTKIGKRTYFSLPPVLYDEEAAFNELLKNAEKKEKPTIGLNNISHITFAKKHPEFDYFADFYLYLSNRESASLILSEVETLVGGYLWLERNSYKEPWPFEPTIIKNFIPPLFISRSCYRHDSLGLPCKGCSRNHSFALSQSGKDYKVIVQDCQSYLISN